jgi:hypothetical protein
MEIQILSMGKEKTMKILDFIKAKVNAGRDNLREWLYTYLYESVSLPEVFEFGIELARVRKRPLTVFMLALTSLMYRLESVFKKQK